MQSTKLSVLVICAGLILAWAAPLLGQQGEYSYMAGYDTGHSGVSPGGLQLPLVLSWRYSPDIKEAVKAVASPVVGPDAVYFPAHNSIYAVDRRTGEKKWELSVGARIYATPLLHDGVLYFGADDKKLWAVKAENGNRIWQFPTTAAVRSAPLYVSGMLYFTSEDGRIYAMNASNHTLSWQFQTGGKVFTTPCYYRDVVFAPSEDEHLYAISARDGGLVWRAQLPSKYVFAAPIIERGKVIVASGNSLIAYDTGRGARRWTFNSGGLISAMPATCDRHIYVGSNDGVVYCLDSTDGRILWRFPAQGVRKPVSGPLSIADGKVFARFGKTNMAALGLTDGALLWEYKLPEPKALAQAAAPTPGTTPTTEPAAGAPDMGPGGMMPMEEPGGRRGGRTPVQRTTILFEDSVVSGLSLSLDSAYIMAADGLAYGFESAAADNVRPQITAGLLDVPGRGGIQARFPLVVDRGDTFPGRYADLVEVPGAPPIALSVSVVDEGAGINPEDLTVEVDGKLVEATYDAQQGLLWYIYDPRGAAVALPNGIRNFVITATDWVGNEVKAQLSFTVNNSLEPPGPPEQETRPTMEPGMPGPGPMPGPEGPMVPPMP